MADEEDACARAAAGPDRLDDLVRARDGQRDRRTHVARAEVAADVLPREVERAVLEVGREHLVARLQADGQRGDVHARRRVRDEDEVVGIGADVGAERRARIREQPVDPPREEEHRLALELELPLLVALEHGSRARAERAVVQKRDVGSRRNSPRRSVPSDAPRTVVVHV